MSALALEGVAKTFRGKGAPTVALDDVSFTVPEGAVFGLLGPNGAGKSTMVRIVLGLVRATRGRVRIFDVADAPLRQVGALIETPAFYPHLTARETLEALALYSGVRDGERTEYLLARVGLSEAAHRRVRDFSVGMKQRLGLAAALVGRPRLVVLDEPTNGLDPAGILEMRSFIRSLAQTDGCTVVLSSHLLDEVERTCDHLAILDHGKLVAAGATQTLLAASDRLRIEVDRPADAARLLGPKAVIEGEAVWIEAQRAEAPGAIAMLTGEGFQVFEARWERARLEDIFFRLTGGAS
ncbi:MAG: ABC transporter ATP-binding protein [Alphaproteobacteria bacterium]|nr:ABC transporter ATP-binding protein [Alphaproteobacteria bacterium]